MCRTFLFNDEQLIAMWIFSIRIFEGTTLRMYISILCDTFENMQWSSHFVPGVGQNTWIIARVFRDGTLDAKARDHGVAGPVGVHPAVRTHLNRGPQFWYQYYDKYTIFELKEATRAFILSEYISRLWFLKWWLLDASGFSGIEEGQNMWTHVCLCEIYTLLMDDWASISKLSNTNF